MSLPYALFEVVLRSCSQRSSVGAAGEADKYTLSSAIPHLQVSELLASPTGVGG